MGHTMEANDRVAAPIAAPGAAAGEHGAIEGHSIDFIPESERTDRLSRQGPFWFLGNFTFFTMTIGFVGPSVGLSAIWTTVAGTLGIMFGTLFMAFHGSQGPHLGLPQMIQSRAQFGYRGVIVALVATLFVFVGFNVVNVSLMVDGVRNVFGIDGGFVALAAVATGALLAIYGHDLMHRAFTWALVATLPLYALVTLALAFGVAMPATGAAAAAPAMPAAAPGFNWPAGRPSRRAGDQVSRSIAWIRPRWPLW